MAGFEFLVLDGAQASADQVVAFLDNGTFVIEPTTGNVTMPDGTLIARRSTPPVSEIPSGETRQFDGVSFTNVPDNIMQVGVSTWVMSDRVKETISTPAKWEVFQNNIPSLFDAGVFEIRDGRMFNKSLNEWMGVSA